MVRHGPFAPRCCRTPSNRSAGGWRDARDPRANVVGAAKVLAATIALVVVLAIIWMVSRRLRDGVTRRLAQRLATVPDAALGLRTFPLFLCVASRSFVLLAWCSACWCCSSS